MSDIEQVDGARRSDVVKVDVVAHRIAANIERFIGALPRSQQAAARARVMRLYEEHIAEQREGRPCAHPGWPR